MLQQTDTIPADRAAALGRIYARLSPEQRVAAVRDATGGRKAFAIPTHEINDVYLPHLKNMARTQILYGGSSSGKSRFKAQQAVIDVLSGNGRNWMVCRKIGKDNRGSTFVEIKDRVIEEWGLLDRFKINETNLTITADNGYQIIFKGLDDLEKVKSIVPKKGAFTDVWIEEATQVYPNDIKHLYKRQRGGDPNIPKRIHLTFNPIIQLHHIYNTYFASAEWGSDQTSYTSPDNRLSILKTWYIHNRFLTPDDISDLENEENEYFRDVYTFGNWGVLGDSIFKNWVVEDLSDMANQFTNRRNGLDFGFSSDPAAVVTTHYDRREKTIYIFGELYERGLTNDILAQMTAPLIERDNIVCDSAEPKSIAELRQHGLNAVGAKKGKDSVLFGVQWLQQQKIIIDVSCINAKNEFMQYQWRKDKDGNAIRQPVDKLNHIIDALRYAYESDMMLSPSWDNIADLGEVEGFTNKWG